MKAAIENVGYDLKAKSFTPTPQNDFERLLETEEFGIYRKQFAKTLVSESL